MKLVVLDGYTLNPGDLSWDAFKVQGDIKVYDRLEKDDSKILEAIGEAEAIFTNKTVLSAEVIQQAPNLKYIGVLATGYNVVDIDAARKKGITVTNVPGYSTNAVAQMTFALLLELANRVGRHCISVQSGDWARSVDFSYLKSPQTELYGKTFGIVGYGQIGSAVARIATAFGMEVQVFSRRDLKDTGPVRFVSMEALFTTSDIISLHCPLTPDTERLIRKEHIAKMKTGVFILNTARGGLIDEQDLVEALNSGKIGGAALDVVSEEPMLAENPLLHAKNCIITPHIAWATKAARLRLMEIAAANLKQFLAGNPVNVIS